MKRFEPRMNANKRELKDFLLPRSSRKARRKAKEGTTEITESHGRKEFGDHERMATPVFAKALPRQGRAGIYLEMINMILL